jgi:hypothetical protein
MGRRYAIELKKVVVRAGANRVSVLIAINF